VTVFPISAVWNVYFALISHRRPYDEAPDTDEMLLEDRSGAMEVVFDWE
jgi:hypothetical protein